MHAPLQLATCPACGAGETRAVADADDIRREVAALWAHHLRRLRDGTPPERLYDRVAFSQAPPVGIVACTACGTLFRDPVERPDATEETYAEEQVDADVLAGLFHAQKRVYRTQAERLTRVAGRAGTGIELGSYAGAFLAAAAEAGWRFTGVDVNPTTNRFARERGLCIRTGTLERAELDGPVDAVAIWNCFEQLPAPRATLRAAHALLRPGGVLALRIPNGAFYDRLRPHLDGGLGPIVRTLLAANNLLGFPYRHGFTPDSLRRLVEDEGFRVLRVVPDTLVPLADRWTRRWAALEERVLKAVHRVAARWSPPPWFELYARRPFD